ncbi:ABC transporter substrate-binding protein [Puerhibacterium sp. TATVAM-FAB25]|uniref:ABC transporter substrate-binding protein n=1 Tax=Puerhibacterium sp. TATVAM-FAB25 TaxID=3093699 RepID=UPI00397D948A
MIAVAAAASLTLSACSSSSSSGDTASGGSTGGGSAPGSSKFEFLGQTENTTIDATLTALSTGACSAENDAAPYSHQTAPGASFDQKLQLLAGQDALPQVLMAAGTPALNKQFIEAGQLEDLGPVLEEAGAAESVLPAARSTVEALYGGFYALPTEFNIEGIWYNKQIFADNGIEVPDTWDGFIDAVKRLDAAGVQPLTTPGKDNGWNITRLIGGYIFRDLGPDALQKVADGQAELTDPEYVKAADAVAELGELQAYGPAPSSIDYNGAMNQFLTGEAAMLYMGSWALGNFNDPAQNKIGADNIGFMPFPNVTGGAGSIDQVPANVGVPIAFGAKDFGTTNADWVACIAKNYGGTVLENEGVVSGFTIDNPPADLPALTQSVQETMADAETSVLWFEALFTAKGTTVSQNNAIPLISGQIDGKQFMELVQSANAS